MLTINQPFNLLLVFSVIIPAALAVAILNHRPNLGVRAFFALMTSVALWAFLNLFEVFSNDPQTKIFSYQIKFLFIVLVPVAWLAFSLYYTHRVRRLQMHHLALMLIIPALTLVMMGTNTHHHLIIRRFELVALNGYTLVTPHYGPYFWFHTGYSYLLILIGFIFLTKPLLDAPAHYRGQVVPLLVGGLAPWISNVLFVFKIGKFHYFDLTTAAFTISGIAFMWGILRYKLLDIVPIARDVVIQTIKDGIIVVDNHGSIIDLNATARELTGIGRNNVIGARATHIIPWWPARAALDGEEILPELELQHGKRRRIFQMTATPLRAGEKPLGHLVTIHDTTDMQMAQLALRDSKERFKSLSENAPIIIFSLDENCAINYVNPAWQTILGYDRDSVIGKPFSRFVTEDEQDTVMQWFHQLIQGKMATAEISIHVTGQNGTECLFNAIAATNSNLEGRVTGIIGLAKDVTKERELQQQLLQSQKMEAIGTLAGGIAHDFNNLLMGIQANVSLIRLETGGNGKIGQRAIRIEEQIQSGAALTRQLLGYARKGKYSVATFNLNPLIEDTLTVVQRTNKSIVIHSRLSTHPAMIQADQGQMELVLLNLFLNAVDAMPGGGELTVSTRQLDAMKPHRVQLQVADTGTGMDKATRERIFEPFFTTKEMGCGTGLGMASVYGVVKNHGGDIQVRSEPGRGTVFTLTLPAADGTENRCNTPQPATPSRMNVKKILLVDDEALILKYCHEMISSLGYRVVSTRHSREALDIFKQHAEDFDLVILDMVMPGMDGMQLFHALKKIAPRIKAIITTGYAVDDRICDLIAGGRHGYLRKPFGRDDLAKMINQVLSPVKCPPEPLAGNLDRHKVH